MSRIDRTLCCFWIRRDSGTKEDAKNKAKEINAKAFINGTFGYAKAVCKSDIDKGYYPKWDVQVLTTQYDDNQKALYDAIRYGISDSLTYKSIKEFDPLLDAIKTVLISIEKNRGLIKEPDKLILKLNKLIVYLTQSCEWPITSDDNKVLPLQKEIQVAVGVFQDFNQRIARKHLSISNQSIFFDYVKPLAETLHWRSMNIRPISLKIISQAESQEPQGTELHDTIRELIKLGIERIFDTQCRPEQVVFFNEVFALHTYVYISSFSDAQRTDKLEKRIERLVEVLHHNDKEYNQKTLFDFTLKLMDLLIKHFDKPSESELQPKSVVSLVTFFDHLVKNEKFIEYMQSFDKHDFTIPQKASTLLSSEHTWTATADFIVFLSNLEFFSQVLEKKLSPLCTLDDTQIHQIFFNLNEKMKVDLFGKKASKEMYLHFLSQLTRYNRLHLLNTYAVPQETDSEERRRYLSRLAQELRDHLVRLGFSVMSGNEITLIQFFSNPAYHALSNTNFSWNLKASRILLKLFGRFAPNVFEYKDNFDRQIKLLTQDLYEGFAQYCELALSKIGEFGGSNLDEKGELLYVDHWLAQDVQKIYQNLKNFVLLCLPPDWKSENNSRAANVLNRLCLFNNQLFQVVASNQKDVVLRPLFGDKDLPPEKTLVVSDQFKNIKNKLNTHLTSRAGSDAFNYLAESYLSYYYNNKVQNKLESLLDIIFLKMQETGSTVAFESRMNTLAEFLRAIAPLFQKLHTIVDKRLFHPNDGADHGHVVMDNIHLQMDKLRKDEKVDTIFPIEKPVMQKGSALDEYYTSNAVAEAIALLCINDVRRILDKNSLQLLTDITQQFESVIARKIDDLSYSKAQFVTAFCGSTDNKAAQTNGHVLQTVLGDLSVKEKVMENFGEYLKNQPVPINFILPNQAIAMTLCTCDAFKDNNLLLKLGTGQGKSLVIAMAALYEAKRIKGNENGKVFVFTSYDHLAKRDHALARYFFEKSKINSVCISKLEDVYQIETETKIIYADIDIIDDIVRQIMLALLENKATHKQIEFLKLVYGKPGEDIRIILDEFDLLLFDMDEKEPFVTAIPKSCLNVQDVKTNKKYWNWLSDETGRNTVPTNNSSKIDGSSGKEFHTTSIFNSINKSFHLPPSVMRLSQLIARAKRVIGLSGTAPKNKVPNLKNSLYFEIPASQDPHLFETKIHEEIKEPEKNETCIRCYKKIELPIVRVEDGVSVIEQGEVTRYCDSILEDIRQRQNDSKQYKRPILIFADPVFRYKTPRNNTVMFLWKTLEDAIRVEYPALNIFKDDVTDLELQSIARTSAVTLSSIKYARGADIRVNETVEEGMHIIGATPVVSKEVQRQMIGRTGRMGRKGSYSLITFGSPIKAERTTTAEKIETYNVLHALTKFFVNKVTSEPYNPALCKKWLIFLGRALLTSNHSMERAHAEEFCGKANVDTLARHHFV